MATSQIEDTHLGRPTEPSFDELAAKYFGAETVFARAEFGSLSHRGLVRSNNEEHYSVVRRHRSRDVLLINLPADSYSIRKDEAYVLAVVDGVGGVAFGELASMLALRTGWELTGTAFKWNFKLSEAEIADLEKGLNVDIQFIHRRLKEEAGDNASYKGMGTTLAGALTVELDAFIVHVGDSRTYLYRWGKLHRLTKDQTLAELMATLDLILTVDEAAQRFQNTLVSCLGGNFEKVEVQTTHAVMEDGDQLLLCSDGLTDMVGDADIASILAHSSAPQTRCQELVDAASNGDGKDNVTVMRGKYSIGA